MKLLLSSTLLIASITCAHAAGTPNVLGQTYDTARQTLAAAGITPLTQEEVAKVSSEPVDDSVTEQRQQGRPEVESCSGAGVFYCYYLLKNKDGDIYGASVYIPEGGGNDRVEKLEKTSRHLELPGANGRYAADATTVALNALQMRVAAGQCDEACVQEEIARLAPKKLPVIKSTNDMFTGKPIPDYRNLNIAELMEITQQRQLGTVSFGNPEYDFNASPVSKALFLASKQSTRYCREAPKGLTCTLIFMDNQGFMIKVEMTGTDLGTMRSSAVWIANADDDMKDVSEPAQRQYVQGFRDARLASEDPRAFRSLMKTRYDKTVDAQMMIVQGLESNVKDQGTCSRLLNRAYLYVGGNNPEPMKERAIDETITVLNKSQCFIQPM